MVRFECDYAAGAHPKVLQALVDTNLEEHPGYGTDPHCDRARALLRDLCQAPDAHIHFLVGGTQANTTVISAALRPHQGVICAQTGHINVHESGAVEATGHKVLTIPSQDGKLTAHQIAQFCQGHYDDPTAEHTVQPGLIYLSHPTELGTVYSVAELEDIRRVTAMAREHTQEFAAYICDRQSAELRREIRRQELELSGMKKREAELEAIFKRLYEDSVLGRITTEQFQTLSASYVAEQEQLKTAIPQKEREVAKLKATVSGADNFIARAKRYTDIQKLTPELLRLFIEKIVVHEKDVKWSKHASQTVEIHYTDIGVIGNMNITKSA